MTDVAYPPRPAVTGPESAPPAPPPPRAPKRRRSRARWLVPLLLLAALLAAGAAFVLQTRIATAPTLDGAPPVAVVEPTPAPKLTARGQLRPVGVARVGTLGGGVLQQLTVEVGQVVTQEQEIARVRGPNGTEVLTAPWRGTITGIPVHAGDTLTPGTVIAHVGDLSRLHVETDDVDEFLIAHVARGQPVLVTIDALEGRRFQGYVRTVALQQQTTDDDDEHYPVVVDLVGSAPELRPGMTVRVDFAPR